MASVSSVCFCFCMWLHSNHSKESLLSLRLRWIGWPLLESMDHSNKGGHRFILIQRGGLEMVPPNSCVQKGFFYSLCTYQHAHNSHFGFVQDSLGKVFDEIFLSEIFLSLGKKSLMRNEIFPPGAEARRGDFSSPSAGLGRKLVELEIGERV